jgi:Arc/MetJ-type ribon-helix-helix transcriptional regulator
MPKTLFIELTKLTEENHFLDVSEQVRSVVRNKWQESANPQSYHLKKLRQEITDALKSKTSEQVSVQLIKELERIKTGLEGGNNE